VNGDWLAPQTVAPSATQLTPFPLPSHVSTEIPVDRGAVFEARLRRFERTHLSLPGGRAAAGIRASADRIVGRAAAAVVPTVGTKMSIRVLSPDGFNQANGANSCSANGYVTTTGTVRAIGTHAIIVSDDQSPANGFTTADFDAIASEFDTLIYPTDVAYFGSPTDLDGNSHVIIYYTPAVNKMTPANQASDGYVGGFFFAGDLFDPSSDPPTGCRSSNQGEIFYLLAPDPSGVFGNRFDTQFVRDVTRGTVAHEFEHMINAGNRFISPVPGITFETTWLDEGLAHFAEDAVGRALVGFDQSYTVTINDLVGLQQSDPSVLQAYFAQNLARTKYYVERPDTTGPIVSSAKAATNLASRGAAWALLRYVADWFSGGDPHNVMLKLAAGPDTGTVNLTKSAGVPLDTILGRWLVTMYTDHTGIPNLDPAYNYKSYMLRQIVSALLIGNESSGGYLPIKNVGDGTTTLQATVPASSASYFVTSLTTGGARTIKITNTDGSVVTDAGGRIYVIRQQ
jgi:hypothetical protein